MVEVNRPIREQSRSVKLAHNGEALMFAICYNCDMGNTVGSSSEVQKLITDSESAYIVGLWCADGYHRTSSLGLTTVTKVLADRFVHYLGNLFPKERIKWQIYYPPGQKPVGMNLPMQPLGKAKHLVYRPYVNSRPLLRLFQNVEQHIGELALQYIPAYFAGRFDGDGCVNKNLRNDLRITYSNKSEAEVDQKLLAKFKGYTTRVYYYRMSHAYNLYVSRYDATHFLQTIAPYSVKVQSLLPRRDLATSAGPKVARWLSEKP